MTWLPIKDAPKTTTPRTVGTNQGRIFNDWYFESGEWGNEDDVAEDILHKDEILTCWFRLEQVPPEFLR